jgi:PAS domain S-box-containing protein
VQESSRPDPEELLSLLAGSEEWLMQRILYYAKDLGYTQYTSTLEEAWRVSIRGLTDSFVLALKQRGCALDIRCEEDVSQDPAVGFGVAEARLHRSRGVALGMFLPFMKYYRSSFEDLIRERVKDPVLAWEYRTVILRFFDRVEIGYAVEWAALSERGAVAEMQDRVRATVDEKVKYLTIFESVSEPLLLLSGEGTIENINEAAARLFGVPGVSGSAYYSSVAVGEPFAPLLDDVHAFMQTGLRDQQFERELETTEGLQVFVVRIKQMLDVSAKFTGLTVALSDVTERHEVEQELRASQRRYESLFHNMMDAFAHHEVVRDADGHVIDYVFLEMNDAFEKMTGLSAEKSVGKRVTELLPGLTSDAFDWIGTYARVVDAQAETSLETYAQPLGKWYDVQAYPTGPETFAVVFSDVSAAKTEEERLEALVAERTGELRESLDALAEANRVKDDFLASMSHELRTPLNSVLGFSGILLSGLVGELTEEQSRQVGMIRSSGERLLMLVNDVLDLSRIEAGYVDIEVREFDLVSLCEQVADSLRPIAFARGLELIVRYDDLVIPVWTDEDKVAQILLNLISNALKFTDEGRVIVEPHASGDGMTAGVRVSDTGRGIGSEAMSHIFERFHSASLTKPLRDGTGLGLSISRRLAELLDGKIAVESTLGVGSTFSLLMPVRHESARI